jgi:hypothetical protein
MSTSEKWILVHWNGDNLVPQAKYDREMLSQLKAFQPVRVKVARPRSLPRHRLYWAILRIVVENTEIFATMEALHKMLLLACGVTEPLITVDGDIVLLPSSIAFENMDEAQFKPYFDAAMEIIRTRIMPGVNLDVLLREARDETGYRENAA